MSLPVYDSCRPSSRYFSFNEKQPDSSIIAINKVNMENLEHMDMNLRNHNNDTSRENYNKNSNTFSPDRLNDFNTNNNSYINEHAVQGPTADENSFGVFLTKNYRFAVYSLFQLLCSFDFPFYSLCKYDILMTFLKKQNKI